MTSVFGLLVMVFLSVAQPLSLDGVLARAESAATAFRRDLPQVVADESYVQVLAVTPGSSSIIRSLHSEVAMATDEDDAMWYAFRHVLDVNGKPLEGATRGRLEHVLSGPRPASLNDARRIDRQGAPYVLMGSDGPAKAATFPLMVLLPPHQARFAFSKRGEKRVRNRTLWVVGYHEVRGPMFFGDVQGREAPMTGEFWIDPQSGSILRSQFVVDSGEGARGGAERTDVAPVLVGVGFSRINVEVTYQADPALGAAVPVEMTETRSRDVVMGGFGGPALGSTSATHYLRQRLSCVAKYAHYRRVVPSE